MTGVGWVQWLIDGLFFTAGLLIGALVLHEVQLWRQARAHGGMLPRFTVSYTGEPPVFPWSWPNAPTVSVEGPDGSVEHVKPTLHVLPDIEPGKGEQAS